jgi:hypothetical protein
MMGLLAVVRRSTELQVVLVPELVSGASLRLWVVLPVLQLVPSAAVRFQAVPPVPQLVPSTAVRFQAVPLVLVRPL